MKTEETNYTKTAWAVLLVMALTLVAQMRLPNFAAEHNARHRPLIVSPAGRSSAFAIATHAAADIRFR